MLVNGMLGNSESWINITKQDIEDLDKQDTIFKIQHTGDKASLD